MMANMVKKGDFIPTNEPLLNGNERKYILEVLNANWISSGKKTLDLERKFAEYIGVKYAVACSSGTVAIHLALSALGIGPGDEVIIPDFNIICSARMTLLTGAKPVFVDVDKNWCIDPDKIEEKINNRTRVILPVHMYGNPSNMDKIMYIARKHNLFVIEDACAAYGAEVNDKKVGSIGDIGCFSLYASKTVMSGEGGIVVTKNKKVAGIVSSLRNQGFGLENRFKHKRLGFNYRITDLQSAVGLAQLECIEEKVRRKREIAAIYQELLKGVDDIEFQKDPSYGKSGFWMYGILLKNSFGRTTKEVKTLLALKGIGSEYFFTSMSLQKIFVKGDNRFKNFPDTKGKYINSHNLAKRGLYIPTGLRITKKQQGYIVNTLLSMRT